LHATIVIIEMAESGQDLKKATEILQRGELVAIPTETVYGLAASAFNADAVLKIFEVKNRPSFDPLIVHVSGLEQAKDIVTHIPEKAIKLSSTFWPGPLTLLIEKKSIIPDIVTSGLDTVAVRVPNHPMTLELLKSLPFPLAAPSANPFGYVSPTTVKHVNDQLGNCIPYILDGGNCHVGIESTILGFKNDEVEIFRLGGISVEEIEAVIGEVSVRKYSSSRPIAPGSLESHYAPRKKVVLQDIASLEASGDLKRVGMIRFKETVSIAPVKNQLILSESGDLKEAAKKLFSTLRAMDEKNVKYVVAELVPEEGLGRAINDRLRRAAAMK
jgi:L-threonylcarbamoyladenylate synthase